MKSDRYKAREGAKNILGWLVLISVLFAGLGGGGVYLSTLAAKGSKDAITNCPTASINSVTAIVVDNTDALTPIQRADFKARIAEVLQRVPIGGLLEVYSVQKISDALVEPVFSRCHPGRGSDVSEWTANPKLVEKRWQEGFSGPFWQSFDGLLEETNKDESPIMETIQSVSISSLRRPQIASGADRRLVLASDLLQFSSGLNFYAGIPDADAFKKSDAYRRLHADLRDVRIETFLFRRSHPRGIQSGALVTFWSDFFLEQDAIPERFYQIVG